jgi:PPE-repeat protein
LQVANAWQSRARAAASALESAFAMTVHPAVIAANRAALVAMVTDFAQESMALVSQPPNNIAAAWEGLSAELNQVASSLFNSGSADIGFGNTGNNNVGLK